MPGAHREAATSRAGWPKDASAEVMPDVANSREPSPLPYADIFRHVRSPPQRAYCTATAYRGSAQAFGYPIPDDNGSTELRGPVAAGGFLAACRTSRRSRFSRRLATRSCPQEIGKDCLSVPGVSPQQRALLVGGNQGAIEPEDQAQRVRGSSNRPDHQLGDPWRRAMRPDCSVRRCREDPFGAFGDG